ncbi:MAG TPA: hypothetical protein VIG76_02990 [Amnibacterium sp.]|jgi:uncharacterized spore protein YtfJ|uniref:hypothetical protein n=1 Tax=Amnibacterium sp. TaxID=1872496 RepID=UPI002F93123C
MARLLRGLLVGLAAGAAGTTALNTASYVDMVVRARPASSTPETSVTRLAEQVGVQIPGDEGQRKNRIEGLGPLLGIAAGLGVGALVGVARAAGIRSGAVTGTLLTTAVVLVASNGPMTVLKVTDPRTWSATDWISDLIPHLAYGVVTHATAVAADR